MRKIIVLIISIVSFIIPFTAEAQARSLPEFLEAYAARCVDFSGDFDDTVAFTFAEDDGSFLVLCTAGAATVDAKDLGITSLFISYMDWGAKESSDEIEARLWSAGSAIAALEHGALITAWEESEARSESIDILTEDLNSVLIDNLVDILAGESIPAYQGENYDFSFEYQKTDVSESQDGSEYTEMIYLIASAK